jgi:hypothetical protein
MSADPKNKTSTNDAPVDPTGLFTNFWAQWMEQSARGTQMMLEAMQEVGDPAAWQKRWLSAMEDSIEDFMRTPAYMEVMRRTLKLMTDTKVAQDQVVHGMARHVGMPLAGDITGLFERLHSTEQTILARLGQIEGRLGAIEEALTPSGKNNGPAHRRRAGPGPRGKSTTK